MTASVLVINAGSSSVKFQLFVADSLNGIELRTKGQIDGIGTSPRLLTENSEGQTLLDQRWSANEVNSIQVALERTIPFLWAQIGGNPPIAVGHRVVHGGPDYDVPVIVDDIVLARLETLAPLAPLHQLNSLAPIRAIRRKHPELPQIACFDTSFHNGHPEVADRYALPEQFHREGVRRYGFHGLSYEYIARSLPDVAPDIAKGRVIVAHLGSGISIRRERAG